MNAYPGWVPLAHGIWVRGQVPVPFGQMELVARLEQVTPGLSQDYALASIAVSLKRLADQGAERAEAALCRTGNFFEAALRLADD